MRPGVFPPPVPVQSLSYKRMFAEPVLRGSASLDLFPNVPLENRRPLFVCWLQQAFPELFSPWKQHSKVTALGLAWDPAWGMHLHLPVSLWTETRQRLLSGCMSLGKWASQTLGFYVKWSWCSSSSIGLWGPMTSSQVPNHPQCPAQI